MRTRSIAASLAILVASAVGAAAAPKVLGVNGVAKELRSGLVYVAPSAKLKEQVSVADLQAVALAHKGYRLAILTAVPKGTVSAEAAAQQVYPKLATVKPKVAFVAIEVVRNGAIQIGGSPGNPLVNAAAAKQAIADGKGDPLETMRLFTAQAASGKVPGDKASSGGGSSTWLWLLIAAVVGGAALLALRMRKVSRERRGRARVGSIGTARTFHLERLDRLSGRHAALVRAVSERPDDPTLLQHHETAGATLVAIRRQMAGLFSPRELRTCALELDQAEWHVESAEALVAGRALPPQLSTERPGLCFFTHEHGIGSVEIDLVKPDGTIATVWVCPQNAAALSRGEELLVSSVHVGSRLIPWPAAPTYYGAPGWSPDDLPGLEYQGREIWGRSIPSRDEPLDLDPGAIPGIAPEQVLPPGVATPLPPGVIAPPLVDPLPPGVTPLPPLDDELPIPGLVRPEQPTPLPAPDPAEADPPPPSRRGTIFEELDEPPPPALVDPARLDDTHDATAEHPALQLEPTQAFEPFADEDDHLPPWERDDPEHDRRP
jgi:hypothetical protein